jgi:hypothetical protein
MQAQTQPSTSPPQTPHTHPAPRPDPRSTLCHADPAAHAHSHSSSFSLSLSLSQTDSLSHTHTHWQHTGNTLTDTQTHCLTLSRFWSTAVPGRLHACRESDRLPAQHTEQPHVSEAAPRQECRRSRDIPGTLLSLTETQKDPKSSEITIWDLPEASGSPGTGTS